MSEIKIKSVSKSKIKLADCGLKTEDFPRNLPIADFQLKTKDFRHKSRFAYCLLPTAYLFRILLTAYCLLAFTTEINPTIRYISHTGSSTPPYTSWETAADSIQKAIDICEPGDTVLVANGVYYENLVINTQIELLGLSMDSTVIDGRGLGDITITFNKNFRISNFNIYGKGYNIGDALFRNLQMIEFFIIENCRLSNSNIGISYVGGSNTSIVANRLMIESLNRAFSLFNEGESSISGCLINLKNQSGTGVRISFAPEGIFSITSNVILFSGSNNQGTTGISIGAPKRVNILNNLISGFTDNIFIDDPVDTVFIINNILANQFSGSSVPASLYLTNDPAVLKNTALVHNKNAIRGDHLLTLDYNLFWSNINDLTGLNYGENDIVADPMFEKDTVPRPNGSYDFHLQAFSPAIDAGDTAIWDVDGSRSDIGMYGGPFGKSYKYKDLAPKPPRNFSAVVDSIQILVKWNRNTEADTSHYKVYRDTVANFTIDSTKLISAQADTFYIQYPPYQNAGMFIK